MQGDRCDAILASLLPHVHAHISLPPLKAKDLWDDSLAPSKIADAISLILKQSPGETAAA